MNYELLHWAHSFHCHFHGFDEAFVVEKHFVDAGYPVVAVCFAEWTAMKNNVPLIIPVNMNH